MTFQETLKSIAIRIIPALRKEQAQRALRAAVLKFRRYEATLAEAYAAAPDSPERADAERRAMLARADFIAYWETVFGAPEIRTAAAPDLTPKMMRPAVYTPGRVRRITSRKARKRYDSIESVLEGS